MKKIILIVLSITLLITGCNKTNEIDRLADKYRGLTRVRLSNNIDAVPSILKDNDSIPVAITLMGETDQTKELSEVVADLIQEKIKKGYTFDYNVDPTKILTPGFHPTNCTPEDVNTTLSAFVSTVDYTYHLDSLYFNIYIRPAGNVLLFSFTNRDKLRETSRSKVDF
jgi:hypothetical protein